MSLSNQQFSYDLDASGNGYSGEFRVGGVVRWHDLRASLVNAGVLPEGSTLIRFRDLKPWERAGAETYSCLIEVEFFSAGAAEKTVETVIVKAMTSITRRPEQEAYEWFIRAALLESHGVKTAVLGATRGSLYQRFIPESLIEYIDKVSSRGERDSLNWLGETLYRLAEGISLAGFMPISLLSDLRIVDREVYVTDLGFDLGGPSAEANDRVYGLLRQELKSVIPTHSPVQGVYNRYVELHDKSRTG